MLITKTTLGTPKDGHGCIVINIGQFFVTTLHRKEIIE